MDLNFRMVHQNFNVADLDTSLDFYEKALGLTEKSRIDGDGFTIVYVGNDTTDFVLGVLASIKPIMKPCV